MSEVRGQRSGVRDQRSEIRNQKSEVRGQKIIGPLFSVFCLLTSVVCPLVEAAELKVGYVEMAKVFDGYERTKVSDATLERQGKQKETELEGRMNELKKLRESLELLNDQAKESKSKEIEEKADELQRFRTNTARNLRRERDKIAKGILAEIQKGIEDYGKANGFSLILDERTVLYGQPVYDVTDEVLKLLNGRVTKAKP